MGISVAATRVAPFCAYVTVPAYPLTASAELMVRHLVRAQGPSCATEGASSGGHGRHAAARRVLAHPSACSSSRVGTFVELLPRHGTPAALELASASVVVIRAPATALFAAAPPARCACRREHPHGFSRLCDGSVAEAIAGDIEDNAVCLSWVLAQPATDLLNIEAGRPRGSRKHDGRDGWDIAALGEHIDAAEDSEASRREVIAERLSLGERRFTRDARRRDTSSLERLHELERVRDVSRKNECGSRGRRRRQSGGVAFNACGESAGFSFCDADAGVLPQAHYGIHGGCGLVIAGGRHGRFSCRGAGQAGATGSPGGRRASLRLSRCVECARRHKHALAHELRDGRAPEEHRKDGGELLVGAQPDGRRSEANDEGTSPPVVSQQPRVRRGDGAVRLVDEHYAGWGEGVCEHLRVASCIESLYRSDLKGCVWVSGETCFHEPDLLGEAERFTRRDDLRHELAAVDHKEHAPAVETQGASRDCDGYSRFAAACRKVH